MRIFVTGGNGFIGHHIIQELLGRDVEVVCYDIVEPFERHPDVHYVNGTILDEFNMTSLMKGCDVVFHLAAILGVKRADQNLLKCLSVNIEGTRNVLNAAMISGIRDILLTSSSEVFGDVNHDKLSEDSPFNPKSGYAVSKLAAEQYAIGYAKQFEMNFKIVRFFNIYGPRQVAEFVVPRFARMVKEGVPPQIYGDGSQIRSFCHIADAARATVDVFLKSGRNNETFNIGNDSEPVSVRELAERFIRIAGKQMEPQFVPFQDSDRHSSREIYYRVPDITKIREVVDYAPQIALDAGLAEVLDSRIPESWADPLPMPARKA